MPHGVGVGYTQCRKMMLGIRICVYQFEKPDLGGTARKGVILN